MRYLSTILIGLVFFASCRDNEFDAPPTVFADPDLEANTTIAELKASNIMGEFDEITEDIIIEGIVTADDRSGNFFREIIIQDASGAISIALDANDLFNNYPVGRRLFVKCQGLWIGDNRGSQQIGGGTELNGSFTNISRIPDALFNQYFFPGALVGQPTPVDKTIAELTPADYNLLINLKDVEFPANLVGVPYANAGGGSGVNQTIVDCNGGSVVMRNSDFASFAGSPMPGGNGDMVCIYSVFVSTPQLKIRDTTDVMFNNATCDGGGGGDPSEVTIESIRNSFTGSSSTVGAGKTIEGIVISDRSAGNINSNNLVIQDGDFGIVLRFNDPPSFNLGDKLKVNVGGGELGEFNGLLQVSSLNLSAATFVSSGNTVTPKETTISAINANFEDFESTLVKLSDVTMSGSTWGDGVTVTDATGSISVFTFFSADFSDDAVPATAESLLAIVSQFNDSQLNLRNADDINGGGGTGGGDPVEVSIQSIRDMWTGTGSVSTIPADTKITGVVISDFENENITGRNLVLQNGDVGIVVRFNDIHSFALGDNLEIVISGEELSDFNGLVQINEVPNANATVTSAGLSITPVDVSVSDIISNPDLYESRLVKVSGVTLSGGPTYGDTPNVNQGGDEVPLYTRGAATFAGDNIAGGTLDITAIVGDFSGVQLNIRALSDIQ